MNLIQYVGMDVHNDSMVITIAPSESTEVRRWDLIGGAQKHVQPLITGPPLISRSLNNRAR